LMPSNCACSSKQRPVFFSVKSKWKSFMMGEEVCLKSH
jgi:hypothetical protein